MKVSTEFSPSRARVAAVTPTKSWIKLWTNDNKKKETNRFLFVTNLSFLSFTSSFITYGNHIWYFKYHHQVAKKKGDLSFCDKNPARLLFQINRGKKWKNDLARTQISGHRKPQVAPNTLGEGTQLASQKWPFQAVDFVRYFHEAKEGSCAFIYSVLVPVKYAR